MFESKANRGRANGYASLDANGLVPTSSLPVIQATVDTGSFVQNNQTGSFVTIDQTGSFVTVDQTGSFATTSSLQTLIDATGSFATTSSLQNLTINTSSLATTGSNVFKGNQTVTGSLSIGGPLAVTVSNGVPNGVSNWNGQGGWNQGYYSNIATTGGTGTGLTVDVAAGGGGYINISAISIHTPGTGYTDGDIITINNENNLPGQFNISVASTEVLQCDVNGNLILSSTAPTSLTGSLGDKQGTVAFDTNYLYYCTENYVGDTFYVYGHADGTHVIVPNAPGIPAIQSNGWTITINGTPHSITGAYPPNGGNDYWYLEFDNLQNAIGTATQLMTLVNVDYQPTNIWKKVSLDSLITGSLYGTSSYSISSSYSDNSLSASFATTASYLVGGASASYALTASYSNNTVSASYASTASYYSGSVSSAISSSFAITASFAATASYFNTSNLATTGSVTFTGNQVVTGSTRGNVTALSITSNTASVDLVTGNYFTLQLAPGTNTYINPSNILPGQTSIIAVSTTGSATVSFPTIVKQPSGSSYVPTATTGVDLITLASVNTSSLYVVSVKNMI